MVLRVRRDILTGHIRQPQHRLQFALQQAPGRSLLGVHMRFFLNFRQQALDLGNVRCRYVESDIVFF